MDPDLFTRVDPTTWKVEPTGGMRVPAIIYADEDLIRGMDDKKIELFLGDEVRPTLLIRRLLSLKGAACALNFAGNRMLWMSAKG
jgi:hypothetical protein